MLMHVLQRYRQHTVCFSEQHVTLSLLLIKKPIPKAFAQPNTPKAPPSTAYLPKPPHVLILKIGCITPAHNLHHQQIASRAQQARDLKLARKSTVLSSAHPGAVEPQQCSTVGAAKFKKVPAAVATAVAAFNTSGSVQCPGASRVAVGCVPAAGVVFCDVKAVAVHASRVGRRRAGR